MPNRLSILLLTLLAVLSAPLSAAPVAYSINSDSGTVDSDGLYRIDLATGQEIERIGTVQSLLQTRLDVEGLAFAPDRTLYGVDDETLKLFSIDTSNAAIDADSEVEISGLTAGENDFGMTFACDGRLYLVSVIKKSLYRIALDGTATLIGAEGSLGVNISALAAFGNPVQLYGLENGPEGGGDSGLYQIDVNDGSATKIGSLGPAAGDYAEGGLAFDDNGQLWAITDRRPLLLPSQVMKLDLANGAASDVQSTSEEGFESLAITVPGGCNSPIVNPDGAGSLHPVPTLNRWTLILLSSLMLAAGLASVRRI